MKTKMRCKQCKKVFSYYNSTYPNRKFCSNNCKFKYWKKHKIGAFYNIKIQSKLGKIGALKAHITNKQNGTGLWNPETGRKGGKIGGKIGGKNAQKTLKRLNKSFYNSEVQSKLGVNVQKTLRENFRNLKFKGQYYDSKSEIEISLCLQEQYNYVPKEGETLHIRIGNMECDYLLKKTFIEFHPWDMKLTHREYFNNRRKVLNKNGYKNYPLIVIK